MSMNEIPVHKRKELVSDRKKAEDFVRTYKEVGRLNMKHEAVL